MMAEDLFAVAAAFSSSLVLFVEVASSFEDRGNLNEEGDLEEAEDDNWF